MNAFDRAVQLQKQDETTFTGAITAEWGQGASTFGGLILGILASAIEQCEPAPERRIRTLTGDLFAAVKPGPVSVYVRTLRRGKLQSNLQATLEQDGQLMAQATAMTSGPRPGDGPRLAPTPPTKLTIDNAPVFPLGPPMGPIFGQHFEYRTAGPYPFSGNTEPLAEGLLRESEPRNIWTIPALTAMLDAYWPAYYASLSIPRMMVTVAFTAEYLMDPKAIAPDALLHYRARAVAGRDGFVVELRELWTEGLLVAMNQQTFAVIR